MSNTVKKLNSTGSLTVETLANGNTVYRSYNTPIAIVDGKHAVVTTAKYSTTTSCHTGKVRRKLWELVSTGHITMRQDSGNEIVTFCRMNGVGRGRLKAV